MAMPLYSNRNKKIAGSPSFNPNGGKMASGAPPLDSPPPQSPETESAGGASRPDLVRPLPGKPTDVPTKPGYVPATKPKRLAGYTMGPNVRMPSNEQIHANIRGQAAKRRQEGVDRKLNQAKMEEEKRKKWLAEYQAANPPAKPSGPQLPPPLVKQSPVGGRPGPASGPIYGGGPTDPAGGRGTIGPGGRPMGPKPPGGNGGRGTVVKGGPVLSPVDPMPGNGGIFPGGKPPGQGGPVLGGGIPGQSGQYGGINPGGGAWPGGSGPTPVPVPKPTGGGGSPLPSGNGGIFPGGKPPGQGGPVIGGGVPGQSGQYGGINPGGGDWPGGSGPVMPPPPQRPPVMPPPPQPVPSQGPGPVPGTSYVPPGAPPQRPPVNPNGQVFPGGYGGPGYPNPVPAPQRPPGGPGGVSNNPNPVPQRPPQGPYRDKEGEDGMGNLTYPMEGGYGGPGPRPMPPMPGVLGGPGGMGELPQGDEQLPPWMRRGRMGSQFYGAFGGGQP